MAKLHLKYSHALLAEHVDMIDSLEKTVSERDGELKWCRKELDRDEALIIELRDQIKALEALAPLPCCDGGQNAGAGNQNSRRGGGVPDAVPPRPIDGLDAHG